MMMTREMKENGKDNIREGERERERLEREV